LRLRLRKDRFVIRPAASIDPGTLLDLDASYNLASLLRPIDALRGPLVYEQFILLALQTGEPTRVARALGMRAFNLLNFQSDDTYARKLLAQCEDLAQGFGAPPAIALLYRALFSWGLGEWERAADEVEKALRESPPGRGVYSHWTYGTLRIVQLHILYYRGRLAEAAPLVFGLMAEADRRHDLHAGMQARIGSNNLAFLKEDRVEDALAAVRSAQVAFASRRGVTLYDVLAMTALVNIHLYEGATQRAWDLVSGARRRLERSFMLRSIQVRTEFLFFFGRAALGNQRWSVHRRARVVLRAARKLARTGRRWPMVLAGLLRACAFRVAGHTEEALASLREVAPIAQAADMRLHEAAARWCWAELVHGKERVAQRALAQKILNAQQFKKPDRLVAMLMPSFFDPVESR
jgi:hypothetical protein